MPDLFFAVTGFENGTPITAYLRLSDIQSNTGEYKDCELLYALAEMSDETFLDILGLHNTPIIVQLNRDHTESIGLIKRITRLEYEAHYKVK